MVCFISKIAFVELGFFSDVFSFYRTSAAHDINLVLSTVRLWGMIFYLSPWPGEAKSILPHQYTLSHLTVTIIEGTFPASPGIYFDIYYQRNKKDNKFFSISIKDTLDNSIQINKILIVF